MGDCFREVYERWVTGRSWADLDLDSLGNLNPEVSNGTFEFGMPEQQLYHPNVLGPSDHLAQRLLQGKPAASVIC
jgi:hypothetical protein